VADKPPATVRASTRTSVDSTVATQSQQRLVPAVPAPTERPAAVTQQQQSTTTVSVPAPAPTAVAPLPRDNASEQIAGIVTAYAHALESLDLNELRRVYPSMTAEQRGAFNDFFRSIRTLKATLAVASLQVDGASADAQVTGAFDYVTSSGTNEHRNVNFAATLHRDRGVWTLARVH
jgi:hypothetical protein